MTTVGLLCTIGYQSFSQPDWLSTLLDHDVEAVIDVRDVTLSRKPGFSKSQLMRCLDAVGIEYIHVRALGNPRAYREALRDGLDFDIFSDMFASLLDERDEILQQVLDRLAHQRICLLCCEEDPGACHRSLVAERLRSMRPRQVQVVHLRNEHAA